MSTFGKYSGARLCCSFSLYGQVTTEIILTAALAWGRKAVLVRVAHAGSSLPAALSPRVAALWPCFILSVSGRHQHSALGPRGDGFVREKWRIRERAEALLFYCIFNHAGENGQMALDFVLFWWF